MNYKNIERYGFIQSGSENTSGTNLIYSFYLFSCFESFAFEGIYSCTSYE